MVITQFYASSNKKAPKRTVGNGLYKRLIIRRVNLINGVGPPIYAYK